MTHHSVWLVPDTLGEENNACFVTRGYVVPCGTILVLHAFDGGQQLIPFSGTNTERERLMCNPYTKPVSQLVQKTRIFTSLPATNKWSCSALPYLGAAEQAMFEAGRALCLRSQSRRSKLLHWEAQTQPWAQILAEAALSAVPVGVAELGMLSRNTRGTLWGTKLPLSHQAAMSGGVL